MRRWTFGIVALLCLVGVASADVDAVIQKLQKGTPDQRRLAARELGNLGEEAKKAIPSLINASKDKDVYVRRFAVQSLGKLAPAKGIAPALIAALKDPNARVVSAAAAAMANVGKEGVKPLATIAQNKAYSASVRRNAITALGKMGSDAKEGVPGLIEVLKDREMRLDAAEALGNIGPEAKPALETFKTMMEDRRIRRDRSFARAVRTAQRKIQRAKK